jgi:hypothetical protein
LIEANIIASVSIATEVIVPTSYIMLATVVVALGAVAFVVSRMRKPQNFDHVTQSVLNRIRTEYR